VRFSTRLVLGAVVTVLVTAVTLVAVAGRLLRSELERSFTQELEREARIIAAGISSRPNDLNLSAHRYGALTGRRITFMSVDGEVLGDSDFDRESLQHLENHLTRPEVQQALSGRAGVHKRLSASTNRVELKVAIPAWPGVVRVSAPITQVDAVVRNVIGRATVAAAIAVLFGALLAVLGGQAVARPVRQLAGSANAVVAGTEPKYPVSSIPEIRELAWAFRAMNEDLQRRLADLRREREETSTLIESMEEGVIAADARGRIVLCNGAMRRFLGLGADDPIPNLAELFYQHEPRAVVEAVVEGREIPGREVELDGRNMLMTARPLPDGGAVLGMLDITDLRRLQLIRRDFVANVSHELKTPLTSIVGYTETLLVEDQDAEMRRSFLQVVHDNAYRMQRLVDDLLDLARLESGAWTPNLEPVDLAAVGHEVWTHFAARDEAADIRFEVDVPGNAPVTADREALRHILTNLFDNARRHTPSGGQVTLRARRREDVVLVEVADTGSGIPAEHRQRVFERFYRVDPGRSRQEGGTGLGLSIVKHFVEAHGGAIEIESGLGRGTTVRIRLPVTGG
jgi:two-component system phosphate regulon sensor histidine kinase PhoR